MAVFVKTDTRDLVARKKNGVGETMRNIGAKTRGESCRANFPVRESRFFEKCLKHLLIEENNNNNKYVVGFANVFPKNTVRSSPSSAPKASLTTNTIRVKYLRI